MGPPPRLVKDEAGDRRCARKVPSVQRFSAMMRGYALSTPYRRVTGVSSRKGALSALGFFNVHLPHDSEPSETLTESRDLCRTRAASISGDREYRLRCTPNLRIKRSRSAGLRSGGRTSTPPVKEGRSCPDSSAVALHRDRLNVIMW